VIDGRGKVVGFALGGVVTVHTGGKGVVADGVSPPTSLPRPSQVAQGQAAPVTSRPPSHGVPNGPPSHLVAAGLPGTKLLAPPHHRVTRAVLALAVGIFAVVVGATGWVATRRYRLPGTR
jgi:hypothetical protein